MSHNRRSCLGMRPKAALSSNLSTGPYPYPPTCQRTFQACTLGAHHEETQQPLLAIPEYRVKRLLARAQVTLACDGKGSDKTAPPKQNRLPLALSRFGNTFCFGPQFFLFCDPR